jgi:hypothetical protein
MATETKLRVGMVISALLLLWTSLMWSIDSTTIKNQQQTIDSLQVLNDSLNMELFPTEIELTRYQVAYEIFMERNPKAASQYGDIISGETE